MGRNGEVDGTIVSRYMSLQTLEVPGWVMDGLCVLMEGTHCISFVFKMVMEVSTTKRCSVLDDRPPVGRVG